MCTFEFCCTQCGTYEVSEETFKRYADKEALQNLAKAKPLEATLYFPEGKCASCAEHGTRHKTTLEVFPPAA